MGLYPLAFAADTCTQWGEAEVMGALDAALLPEASGLAHGRVNPQTLYHVNDSGDELSFYVSSLEGEGLSRVRLEPAGLGLSDVEDLAVGPCGTSSCIFLADIGANTFSRDALRIFVVEERATWTKTAPILYTLNVNYPDPIDDAEGLAVHPNGDIYLLSKATLSPFGTAPAQLYRLDKSWQQNPAGFHTLELVATLDLAALSGTTLDLFSHTATALDISADGTRFSVLTYGDVYEVAIDLASLGTPIPFGEAQANTASDQISSDQISSDKVSVVSLERLPQQESLTYLNADQLLYGSEARAATSPIMKVSCLQRSSD